MPEIIKLSVDKGTALVKDDDTFSLLSVDSGEILSTFTSASSEETAKLLPIVAAMDSARRSRKASNQPRDYRGRFVAAGANVKWRSHDQIFTGTVESIKDGKAHVLVRNDDGSISKTTLMPETLQVMATKARLEPKKTFNDPDSKSNDFVAKNKEEIEKAANEEKDGALIKRGDGYSLIAQRRNRDSDPSNDIENSGSSKTKGSKGNAIIYQLYAPNGDSLGLYNGSGDFDQAIAASKSESSPDVVVSSAEVRPYSVPKSVRESVLSYIESRDDIDEETADVASRLCSGDPVSKEDVKFLYDFYEALREVIDLYGGPSGDKWSRKIMESGEEEVTPFEPIDHNFLDDTYDYFVYGDSSSEFVGLIAVDELRNVVLGWTGSNFGMELGPIENFDKDFIEYVDPYTAFEVAKLLHGDKIEGDKTSFSLLDIFPEERNLFSLAHSELDFEFLDKLAYDSPDRSLDAQKQSRGEAGRFGKVASEDSALQDAKYFAILDDVDPTAVMDIIAIKDQDGTPTVFKRLMGQWVPDKELQIKLEGATPPPVSELNSVDEVKSVLKQVDAYDSGSEVTASGFDINQDYLIKNVDDLYVAVYSATNETITEDVAAHIVKRAKALNRLDVVPEEWRIQFSHTPVASYGEYGEVLTASANVQGTSNLEKLENYWLTTDKVDWNDSGAVSFATTQLSKYLGEPRARAFATILKNKAGEL